MKVSDEQLKSIHGGNLHVLFPMEVLQNGNTLYCPHCARMIEHIPRPGYGRCRLCGGEYSYGIRKRKGDKK